MPDAPVEPATEVATPKGDPLKFGIALIAMGIVADVFVVVFALLEKQPLWLLVMLPSLGNFSTGAKNIRIGLTARRSSTGVRAHHADGL